MLPVAFFSSCFVHRLSIALIVWPTYMLFASQRQLSWYFPLRCFCSGFVLFFPQSIWPNLCPEVAHVLMPASLSVRRISWIIPGMYGMRQYGLYSSWSVRSIPRNGRMSKRFSGMSFCLQLSLLLLVMRLFFWYDPGWWWEAYMKVLLFPVVDGHDHCQQRDQ